MRVCLVVPVYGCCKCCSFPVVVDVVSVSLCVGRVVYSESAFEPLLSDARGVEFMGYECPMYWIGPV